MASRRPGIIRSSGQVEALAASVPDTAGVYLVPAFVGLGAPYWDPAARGATGAHIARAALEVIAPFQSTQLLAALQAASAHPIEAMRVDGGATANALLMQIQAELLGIPLLLPAVRETTALGAAYLAGLQAGVWPAAGQIAAYWRCERVFEPAISRDEAATRMLRWREAVPRTRGWETAMGQP